MLQAPAPKQLKPSQHVTVYGLPLETSEERIRKFFSKFGKVKRVHRHNQIVFITFKTSKIAATAFSAPDMWFESSPYRMAYYHAPSTASEANSPENNPSDASTPSDGDIEESAPGTLDDAEDDQPERQEERRQEDRHEKKEEEEKEGDGHDSDRDREGDHEEGDDHDHDDNNEEEEDDGVSEDDGGEDDGEDEEDDTLSPSCSSEFRERGRPEQDVTVKWRAPRDFWADRPFPIACVACIVYEVKIEVLNERQLFELIKKHVKEFGKADSIVVESTSEPLWKKFVVNFSSLEVSKLKCAVLKVNSTEPRFRLFFKPLFHRMPEETIRAIPETETKCENFRLDEDRFSCVGLNVHIPNTERLSIEHFRSIFHMYGNILSMEACYDGTLPIVKIEYATVGEAYAASHDPDYPNISTHASKPSHRLILFYLPKSPSNDEVVMALRRLGENIEMITVDWFNLRAVVEFNETEDAIPVYKKLKMKKKINFGHEYRDHKIAVDYCSPNVAKAFMRHKDLTEQQRLEALKVEREALKAAKIAVEKSGKETDSAVKEKKELLARRRSELAAQSDLLRHLQHDKFTYHKGKCKQCPDKDASRSAVPSTSGAHETHGELANGQRQSDDEENINNGIRIPRPPQLRPHQHQIQQGHQDSLNESHATKVDEKDPTSQPSTSFSPLPHAPPPAATAPPSSIKPNGSANHQRRPSTSKQQKSNANEKPPDRLPERAPYEGSPPTIEKPRIASPRTPEGPPPPTPKRSIYESDHDRIRFHRRLDDVVSRNIAALTKINEMMRGRPFGSITPQDCIKRTPESKMIQAKADVDYFQLPDDEKQNLCHAFPDSEIKMRISHWQRTLEVSVLDEYRSECKDLLRVPDPILPSPRSLTRPNLEDNRSSRMSFDSMAPAPHELAQRSHSLSIGPTTPLPPFHAAAAPSPLLVNTSHSHHQLPGTSHPSQQPAAIVTPRSSQPPIQPSPVSRHVSMSSTGRPANIQTQRHHSVIFPPDVSIPPPPIPPLIPAQKDDVIPVQMAAPPTFPVRRSSETMASLRSPSFSAKNIPPLMGTPTVAPPPSHTGATAGTPSVSSSTSSTPRHSISGTPGPPPTTQHQDTPKRVHQEPTKVNRPEKVQVRHDSISKPGPSSAASALQARSQSMSVTDPKKSVPTTPVVRDAGSDLIEQIISAEHGIRNPNMGFKKLPRIEKKASALSNLPGPSAAPTTSSLSSTPGPSQKDKEREKEKEKRRKEREREEKERQARKEMKRNETKEERHKRKEMERLKREEEERKERKREKQRQKEKEERRKEREKEKEKERRKAEKEKQKRRKQRREEESEQSESSGSEEIDLDSRKGHKEMTQEEKDHQLALLLSRGGIIENIRSRKRTEKHSSDSLEKLRQKTQAANPRLQRRVLIESSDEDEEEEEEKPKTDSSSESDVERRVLPTPAKPPTKPVEPPKEPKKKVHKEREKGELSSSSEEEQQKHKVKLSKVERENRKRQKSSTNYSSDDNNDRHVEKKKKKKLTESEERLRKKASEAKEDQKKRKRKLEHRRSTEEESRRRAKRDFPVQLEDVSDEEEGEEEDEKRMRRPSTSSTTSTSKEKSGKTPLRVVTPAVTPLQSPKIFSPKVPSTPKLLSPKIVSAAKRPSVTEPESLISPRPRMRTTSSTSTTSVPRHGSVSHPGKPQSPAITAKSSISSIDDFPIREDLSQTSATASPMSVTGRPMVLTKAAMKSFHTSPPKRTRGHDDSSSSGDTSVTSSDDSSDDDVQPVSAPIGGSEAGPSSSQLLPPPPMPPPLPPPILSVQQPTRTLPGPPARDLQMPPPPVPPVIPATISHAQMQKTPSLVVPQDALQGEEREEGEYVEEQSPEDVVQPRRDPIQHVSREDPEDTPSRYGGYESSEYDPQPTHSLISDQETEEAVQSIFDEEADDDFPQYPDFAMPKEHKERSTENFQDHFMLPDQDRSSSISAPSTSQILDDDDDQIVIPQPPENPMIEFNEQRRQEYLRSLERQQEQQQSRESEVVVTERVVPMDEMIQQEIVDGEPLREASETPTPELIPNDEESENVPPPEYSHRIAAPVAVHRPYQRQSQRNTELDLFYYSDSASPQADISSEPRETDSREQSTNGMTSEELDKRLLLEQFSSLLQDNEQVQIHLQDDLDLHETVMRVYVQAGKAGGTEPLPDIPDEMVYFYMHQHQKVLEEAERKAKEELAKKQEEERVRQEQEKQREKEEELARARGEGPTPEEIEQRRQAEAQRIREQQAEEAERHFLEDQRIENQRRQRLEQQLRWQHHGQQSCPPLRPMPPEAHECYRNLSQLQAVIHSAWSQPAIYQPHSIQDSADDFYSPEGPAQQILDLERAHQVMMYTNFPLLWCGELLLKSNKTTINLHMVNGSRQFLSNVLGQVTSDGPAHRDSIRITQRLRIDNGQIEHIHRILTNPDYACAIGLSAATDKEKMLTEQAILQTHFQDYLQSKQIAGISRLDSDELNRKARVHVFAPCDLVNKYLAELAPKLYEHLTDINAHFLFFVFTNDEAIPNMTNPPTKDSLVAPANN